MVIISERIYEKDAPLIYDLLGVNEEVTAGNFNAENYFNRAAEMKKRCSETACKAGENTHCKVGENVHCKVGENVHCKMGDIMI